MRNVALKFQKRTVTVTEGKEGKYEKKYALVWWGYRFRSWPYCPSRIASHEEIYFGCWDARLFGVHGYCQGREDRTYRPHWSHWCNWVDWAKGGTRNTGGTGPKGIRRFHRSNRPKGSSRSRRLKRHERSRGCD